MYKYILYTLCVAMCKWVDLSIFGCKRKRTKQAGNGSTHLKTYSKRDDSGAATEFTQNALRSLKCTHGGITIALYIYNNPYIRGRCT